MMRRPLVFLLLLLTACASRPAGMSPAGMSPAGMSSAHRSERVRVLALYPGVTATLVAPADLELRKHVELILYALPNGNTTAETMGRRTDPSIVAAGGTGWRNDIQHIGAQTRALRERGVPQAIVAYLEADTKSWPAWRSAQGLDRANVRIVEIVDQLRSVIGNPTDLSVTLTGHSGGGSFAWGFLDGQGALPAWLERIGFLDSNYSFEPRHGDKLRAWLAQDVRHTLVVLAYDDREIMLDGKKVVSDSGGTWRATDRMLASLSTSIAFTQDTLGPFQRYRSEQVEILRHPNGANRIVHTEMIGEMNGYMHAMLVRRAGYDRNRGVLGAPRAYTGYVGDSVPLPAASPPPIPARAPGAEGGAAFIARVAGMPREEREAAVRAELLNGNIPSFLRGLHTVTATFTGTDSVKHEVSYETMPDYLAIGSDADFVRMPMTPYTAQAFCDAFGFALPTRKMVNDIWAAASVKVEPHPLTESRELPATFLAHDRLVQQEIRQQPSRGRASAVLVAGDKKDVVVSNKLAERPDRVAIYGWHHVNGAPIQPLYTGHVDWYVDYSHGIRPVRRSMRVDGVVRDYASILADPVLHALLSDEGPIARARYEANR